MDAHATENRVYRFDGFEVELGRRILRSLPAGMPVPLTPRAFDLLVEFLRRPQTLIEKAELISALWPDTVVEENNLEHTVFVLRQALGERRGQHRYIKTIHRRGYQFTAPVTLVTQESQAAARDAAAAPIRGGLRNRIALASAILIVALAIALQARRNRLPAIQSASSGRDRVAVLWFGAAQTEQDQLLAESVTYLLEDRLAGVKALSVIFPDSIVTLRKQHAKPPEAARKLGARYLLCGEVERKEDRLHLSARLVDSTSNESVWSKTFDAPVAGITAIREEIVRSVVASTHADPSVYHEAVKAPVGLDVYELYRRGERLISADATAADTQQAAALFTRTTTLDPGFARGFLGVAQALLYNNSVNPSLSGEERQTNIAQATLALDRALALDPVLGRAWVRRAELIADPNKADEYFRRGLALAPNDSVNAMFYSSFLSSHGRMGEALAVVRQARKLDPMSPLLVVLEADAVLDSHSDVSGSERLLNEAHAIDPDFPTAAGRASLRWRWTGEFAEAARLFEHETRHGMTSHAVPAAIYLDMDDLALATRVWNNWDAPPPPFFLIAQYQGQVAEAASLARNVLSQNRLGMFGYAAEAIRDDALARRDYAAALALLNSVFVQHAWSAGTASDYYEFGAAYAHLLILSGDLPHGRRLAKQLLVKLDADEIGRPAHWFSRDRAALLMLLGEPDRALDELTASQALNHWTHWWYTAHDPLYQPLHANARFRKLVDAARQHRAEQRALLEQMRRRGEVLTRRSA